MWSKLAGTILRNRIVFIAILAVTTAFMAYQATQIQLSYEYAKILPPGDPSYQAYERFKKRFGEDGSVMAIGIEKADIYQLSLFNDWYELGKTIKQIEGVKDVLSNTNLYHILRNDSLSRFEFRPLIANKPQSQEELDSLKEEILSLPFYKGTIYNDKGNVHLMAITFNNKTLNSKSRIGIVKEIKEKADSFGKKHSLTMHYSGMPYIRTAFSAMVASEMQLFLLLALGVTASILLIFFRSVKVVFFSMIVVAIGVVWSLGTIVLFGYKITVLSGLIPPLIIVIGVPNSIFLLNKYQEEFVAHGNKMLALATAIEKIGATTFLANVTTAIGFGVFYFTGSALLIEFGLVAALNVMAMYVICLIFIPIVFSYLPAPSAKHVRHLEGVVVTNLLKLVDYIVHNRRPGIYVAVTVIVVLSVWGMTKITAVGYVVDDLPQNDPLYVDLKFFEKNFHGVLPFEITVDTRKKGGVISPRTFTKIKVLQKELAKYDELSRPLSVVEALKFIYQSYKGGNPKYYIVPGNLELNKLTRYTSGLEGNQGRFQAFMDSTRRYTRVNVQMADIGSVETRLLVNELQPKMDSIFNYDYENQVMPAPKDKPYEVKITGSSVIFAKGNDYLLRNLQESLALAIVLISMIMATQFLSFRMIIISIVPSLIPLLITAGIMGYFGIALKPSTILIFSIAFGIASDGTIYFLTKYKEEIRINQLSISRAVSKTIMKTGVSMVYTAVILFAGFAIFAASTFKGTVALGILISITLLIAMLSNLVLLPAFLLSLEKRVERRAAAKRV